MKIGIVGAGFVGTSFGKAVLKFGHEVMFSSRTPESDKMQSLRQETGASIGTVAETVAYGDVVVLATGWPNVPDAVKEGDWSNKIVIDLTNRVGVQSTTSAAQDLAQMTGARVVKAFNTIGAEYYQHPTINGQPITMLIAGDDPEAKRLVFEIAQQLGFDPFDAGDLKVAALLEKLAELWIHLMLRTELGRNFAFQIARAQ
jgi:predicted dinucleotide-binding enzyme